MKITFISLFSDFFKEFKNYSIIRQALLKKLIEIEVINPRDFAKDKIVDDTVYGGGKGMLLMVEPLVKAIESVKRENTKVFLMGPRGKTFDQETAKEYKSFEHLVLVCGHYEGVDARIEHYIDGEISIGNFIITGGESAAICIVESIIRLIPNVIKTESHQNESFESNLLEHDHFTRPADFRGHKVPEVLMSGNHQEIVKWRQESSIKRTINKKIEERKI